MQCFHLRNGGYVVATDCDVMPMMFFAKRMSTNSFFFNMSGIFICCLPSKYRIFCKKTYYSGVEFVFQSDQNYLNIFVHMNVKRCNTARRRPTNIESFM